MTARRVVVTGCGVISSVGNDVKTAWDNVINGRSGIGMIPEEVLDVTNFSTKFGGCIRDFDVSDYMSPKDARRLDQFMHFGIASSNQAIADSGLEVTEANADRIGVAMGSGIGGLGTIETNYEKYMESGPRKISPVFVPGSIINMISGQVSMMHNMRGPNLALVTACTTSTHSLGIAARTIAYGDADVMVAGGAEHAITPLGLGGFASSRALSGNNDDPQGASRPWDDARDGFVLSDGSATLVLEEYEFAKARGATIYAELVGFGMSGDAHHMTAPPEDGNGGRRSMQAALNDAGLNPEDVDYINAHGTSTPLGDLAETKAIKALFGDHAYKVAVSSTKSMTGHMLGAAGAIEALFSVLAIRDQIIPPTINLENPSEGCDLDYVPGEARSADIRAVVSNSFGFGGTNGSLAFKRIDD
jgi:3-oxoacyl-[acyl-carrier-protein] synthase II